MSTLLSAVCTELPVSTCYHALLLPMLLFAQLTSLYVAINTGQALLLPLLLLLLLLLHHSEVQLLVPLLHRHLLPRLCPCKQHGVPGGTQPRRGKADSRHRELALDRKAVIDRIQHMPLVGIVMGAQPGSCTMEL